MNRLGCALLALFLIVAAGFVLMIRSGGEIAPQAPSAPATSPQPEPGETVRGPSGLVIPVAGVRPDQLVDTFTEVRGERVHGALDIMAPRGTPVVAAAAGRIEKIFESDRGGHTVYVRSEGDRWIQYYAHLDSYAEGLREGMHVTQGQILGTVGASGDANPAAPHLHFEIKRVEPGQTWYQGGAINPYPLLAGPPTAR